MKPLQIPKQTRLFSILILIIAASYCRGAVYYIDFDNGDDGADGLSQETAWKHAPEDGNARKVAKSTVPTPGDVYHFKGGVFYRSQLNLSRSGDEDNPIIYDGNSDGSWGEGRAIIDGSEPLLGWTQCASAEEADGNPAWEQIYWTYLPAGSTAFDALLFEDSELLHIAQDPNLTDPFWWDNLDVFLSHDSATDTTIVDADYFTQNDPGYWSGSTYIHIHGGNNNLFLKKVTGYNPAAQEIQYEPLGYSHSGKYSMANSLKILDAPGEFVVREDQMDENNRVKVYFMPLSPGIEGKIISRTTRLVAFHLGSQSHLVIKGFTLQCFSGGDAQGAISKSVGKDIDNILITNNVIRNIGRHGIRLHTGNRIIISDNTITHCRARGIFLSKVTNSSIRYNRLHKNGETAIDYYTSHDCDLIGNVLTEHLGHHANGLTIYLESSNIRVIGNTVTGGKAAFTTSNSTDITVAYNVFGIANAYYSLADWGNTNGLYIYNNYTINAPVLIAANSTNIVAKNNIMAGSNVQERGGVSENNIYTVLTGSQTVGSLGAGEFVATEADLFVDPENSDYRLKADSPAIDKGVPVGFDMDIIGTEVPQGAAPDIGPYERIISYWRGLSGGVDGYFHSQTSLGWVYTEYDPWIWSQNLDGWLYMTPQWTDLSTMHAGWIFCPK